MSEIPSAEITQDQVISRDGTPIGYLRLGTGAPLIVCHGAFTVAAHWLPFAQALAAKRTVYLYDRRGRGASPLLTSDYSVDAEVDDLAAILTIAGEPAALLGHSFGGGCALALAARGGFTGQLIVYEPGHSAPRPISGGHRAALEAILAQSDFDKAVGFAMTHVVKMPAAAVEQFRSSPLWDSMCQTIRAFPNELRFLDSLTFASGELAGIAPRVTLLLGTETRAEPGQTSTAASLVDLIPGMVLRPLPGQGHVAYLTAPALLADIVGDCLDAT